MSASCRCRVLISLIALLALFIRRTAAQDAPQASPPAQAAPAQSVKDTPERQHAQELYRSGKFVEAMPLLEKLASDSPSDLAVKEAWAYSLVEYSATLRDPELRKKARMRARSIALEAKKLGDNSSLLQMLLDIPEDGGDPKFSDRKDVDDAMKAAEADFARGDLDKARDGYLRVLLIDPANYDATLFIGDVYFKQHVNGSAGEWFARAIQVDPNRETAYRYWGDALWDMSNSAAAREKYIQAVVAEPYNRRSWVGLNQWAQRTKIKMNWVRLQDKGSVTKKDDSHINITIDTSSLGKGTDPNGVAWLTYSMDRALWTGDKFKKEFPNEPVYRRTMREEADCLHLMVSVLTENKDFDKKKKDLDPALVELVKIDQMGLLEPFVLLNRADADIAKDYPAYRDAHRDTVYRYFDEYVVPKAPAQ